MVLNGTLGVSWGPRRGDLFTRQDARTQTRGAKGGRAMGNIMDGILIWNAHALEVARRDFSPDTSGEVRPQQPGPTRTSRALAIVHVAMFDAFAPMSVSRYGAYTEPDPGLSLGGRRAAMATAAALTLVALFDRQRDWILSQHQSYLAGLGASSAVVNRGVAWGRYIAETILRGREGDGAERSALLYAPSPEPGQHRPDPLNPGQGVLDPHWGGVRPFGVPNLTSVITPVAPPTLGSPTYAAHFEEVKAKGAATGSTRTPDETVQGVFWAYDGARDIGVPPRLYNQVVRAISTTHEAKELDNARLFAAVNVAMADAGIQAWHEKYLYNVWRPVVGVREADAGYGPTGGGDGNLGTAGDPGWLPYGSPRSNQPGAPSFTPGFPAYPSGHATFGAAALKVAELSLGLPAGFTFQFVSDELNGVTQDNRDQAVRPRHVRTLTIQSAIRENLESRVFLGVHWRFDGDRGREIGEEIARQVHVNFPTLP